MATTFKILGQANPAGNTTTTLYTVPGATQTVISTLTICNHGSAGATYRIWISENGAAANNAQLLAWDVAIDAYDTVLLTAGYTMGAADLIRVRASTANVAFGAFGSEIT